MNQRTQHPGFSIASACLTVLIIAITWFNTTARAESLEGFDHSNVTGLCLSCHNGTTATGKSTTHFVTTLDCERCHATTQWIPLIRFRHDSPDYPGDHRTSVLCVDCHNTNNQVVAWPFPAYQLDCAGCHANVYTPGSHDNKPIVELRDCAGSCHLGGITRSNQHRPSAGGW